MQLRSIGALKTGVLGAGGCAALAMTLILGNPPKSDALGSAPVTVSNPDAIQASNNHPGAPISRDDSAETMKIPEPIIDPTTIMVASSRPRERTRFAESVDSRWSIMFT